LIYARARTGSGPFAEAFAVAFREIFAGLDNAAAAFAIRTLLVSPRTVASDLRWATPAPVKDSVPLQDALTLLHVY
jgi:hypothetical protein